MSKTTVTINRIKNKLDSISGLDGNFVHRELYWIETFTNSSIKGIKKHLKNVSKNGTIFE